MGGRRCAAIGMALALLVGCSGGDDDDDGADPEPTATPSPSPTPSPTPSGSDDGGAPTTAAPEPAPPPPADGGDGGDGLEPLPGVVGLDLQLAQDTMQAAGYYVLISHDAGGQGRLQVLDRNWTVCDQSPAAGTRPEATTTIDLGAVKDDEACPG